MAPRPYLLFVAYRTFSPVPKRNNRPPSFPSSLSFALPILSRACVFALHLTQNVSGKCDLTVQYDCAFFGSVDRTKPEMDRRTLASGVSCSSETETARCSSSIHIYWESIERTICTQWGWGRIAHPEHTRTPMTRLRMKNHDYLSI